ncbi:MAG: hypothetical protein JWM65_1257 [Sphingomonas bacterium]|nr:hypothetical protein [Sphingomonas bacterium]
MRRHSLMFLALCSVAALGTAGLFAQAAHPPRARYQMDASTVSGFAAGGGNPMRSMFGGGGGGGTVSHQLLLRLGSTLAPNPGGPRADHFMPQGMSLGASVPLETPTRAAPQGGPGETPQNFRRPKGRLLIFWGCGAHAGPGQPVIIDFSKVAQGQFPPGLFSGAVPVEGGPTAGNSRTFGDWPNSQSRRSLPGNSSLLGQHRVAGNYSPEMSFALDQDFMPAINGRSSSLGGGATLLNWNPVAAATGYYAWMFGAKSMGEDNADMVWWTSASRQEFGGGLWDWLSPETVARLIGQKVVMPPSQTSCTIPAEVKTAAGEFMMASLYAYGPERSFAYPPRPANPRLAWNPDWTAKVRYRATTMMMIGVPGMDGADASEDGDDRGNRPQPQKRCKPSLGSLFGVGRC